MKNFSTQKERIIQFIDYKGISKNKFYIETGISNGVLDKSSGLSMDTIERFYSTFPEINPEWLLTGKGEMLKTEVSPAPVQEVHPANNPLLEQENIFLKEKIALLEENKALQECKETLYKDKIASLQREIKRLEQEIADLKKEPKPTVPTAFVAK